MDKELLSRIREKISRNIGIKGDSYAVLSNPGYSPVHISEDYFHDFDAKNSENKKVLLTYPNLDEKKNSSNTCLPRSFSIAIVMLAVSLPKKKNRFNQMPRL